MSMSKSPHMKMPKGSSAKVHIPSGSGSRPSASKTKIMTTSPSDPHGLGGRNVTKHKPLK